MKGKNTQASETFGDALPASSPSPALSEEPSARFAAQALNFQSQQFNTIDDLDDNTGNYRSFRSLEGIVTADMRYHQERKRTKKSSEKPEQEVSAAADTDKGIIEKEVEELQPLHPLTLSSRGRTLVIGNDLESALECGEVLTGKGLKCAICIPNRKNEKPSLSRVGALSFIEVETVSVTGSFCGFTALAGSDGIHSSFSSLFGKEFNSFDLILDLQSAPVYQGKQLPAGYYSPGNDRDVLDQALSELPEMKGLFTKPQFTALRKKECIHGRSDTVACNRCLEVCPVSAIRSDEKSIFIDHYLCQGCAGCELVCPTGAIRMVSGENVLSNVVKVLRRSENKDINPPALVLYDGNISDGNLLNEKDGIIFFSLEEIASAGLHVQLTALAYGAGSVTIVCDYSRPDGIREALKKQVELGRTILHEMDLPADCLRLIDRSFSEKEVSAFSDTLAPFVPAEFSLEHDKRSLVRMAVQHLSSASGNELTVVPLPAKTPFGAVAVNPTACSLCMACVSACPSEALEASGDMPRISMIESRCHQCGLCAAACPENAIQLHPRILTDVESADSQTVLHEVEPFRCIECGEPFASRAMVNRMQEKLDGHWMYGSEHQKKRLEMCRACRTRDALQSGDYR